MGITPEQLAELKKLGAVIKEYEVDGEIVTLQSASEQEEAEKWEKVKKVTNPFQCLRVAKMTTQRGRW